LICHPCLPFFWHFVGTFDGNNNQYQQNGTNVRQPLAYSSSEQQQLQALLQRTGVYQRPLNLPETVSLPPYARHILDTQQQYRQLIQLASIQNQERNAAASLPNPGLLRNTASLSHPIQEQLPFVNDAAQATLPVQQTTSRSIDSEPSQTDLRTVSNRRAIVSREHSFEPENVRELSLSSDSDNLSEYQCLLRQQIVLFSVSAPDIQCSAQGRNKPIVLGQVGVVCRHCAYLTPGMRPSGAVYFPAKLSGLYQASQNMAINHFQKNCHYIPDAIRESLVQLKGNKSTVVGGGKNFWANGAKVLGVVECDDQLRFADDTTTNDTEL
jgi:hypothetical protein